MKLLRNGRASLHAELTLVYTTVIVLLVVVAGLVYAVMTTTSINAYAAAQAEQSARTLGATLADAVSLENQGALRARSEAAHAMLSTLEDRVAAGATSAEAARQLAVQFLGAQQIGEMGYFFVIDSNADVAYHPYEEIQSENQADAPIVQQILEQQTGFVRYSWQNPSETSPSDKYGYVAYFAPWDWYVAATDYALGVMDRLPAVRLQSLLNGSHSDNVLGVVVRASDGSLIGESDSWDGIAADAASTAVWSRVATQESRVERTRAGRYLALAPVTGFDAEVGVVFSAAWFSGLTTRLLYSMLVTLAVAVGVISISSRIASKYIARPVQLMSERLNRRLPAGRNSQALGGEDLHTLVLQQLRALVRLDYETKGRRAAERDAMVAESVFTNTTEGILVTNADAVIIRVNPAFETMSGYSGAELIGENPRILKSGRQAPEFYADMWASLAASGSWVGEVWNRRKDGDEYPELLSIRAVCDAGSGAVESYVAVCHDISERKETEDRLQHLATHDELTGLPNRAYLNGVLSHTVRQAKRHDFTIAVLFLDIDDFKDVNDSHGHDMGDKLLQWIARRLEFQLRSEDIVVRFGGDEFVIVLPGIEDSEYASVVARRILAAVREPYMIGAQKIRPSVSIGIAVFPEAGRAAEELLRDADAAMYAAKRQGRNTYRFHNPGMNENAHRRLAMQGSVASAIDRGEFMVVYQPILALESGTISGAEALVRWNHDGRIVSPGEFLPYLENSSMLTRLDLWVLEQVCTAIRDSDGEYGDDFVISVNAGAYNLVQDDYVGRVTEVVARSGVDPGRLAIEVTESAAIRNFDRARATLRDLQSAGLKLYLDDFGEGHSSIRYLREFGVDSVKLDRVYVMNVEHDESARSLVSGFTQLAHGMRLKAIIEGIETQGQLDFVRSVGCDHAQGFLIGRPGDFATALGSLRTTALR